MRLKLLGLALLFPAMGLILILLFHYSGNTNFSIALTVHIAYLITIFIAIKAVRFKFSIKRWILSPKLILTSFILALFIFFTFYLEKIFLGNYTKGPFTFLEVLSSVILAPVLEEFFSKGILMENLKKVVKNPFLNILIIALYFWVFHFPTIMITHFILGLLTAYVYYYRKNLLEVIAIHSFYNGFIVIFNYS